MPGGGVSRLVVRAESRLCHMNEYLHAMEYACSSPADIEIRVFVCARFRFFMPIILCDGPSDYDVKILYE